MTKRDELLALAEENVKIYVEELAVCKSAGTIKALRECAAEWATIALALRSMETSDA